MNHIKRITALAAALFLAASLAACGSSYSADSQFLDTPAKASLSAATGNIFGTTSNASEEDSSSGEYAGEYVLFGIGDADINFQDKKIVVTNEGDTSGSVILYSDGTGAVIDSTVGEQEAINTWTINDGAIHMVGDNYEFSGTLEDGVIKLGSDTPYYFGLEGADLSSYSIVSPGEYATVCMSGTYYLTKETMADGSVFLNRTQISLNVLNGLGEASLKLYEDGTGALDVGDHQNITWNNDAIILNDQTYTLSRDGKVITVDMKDYTIEFSYIGEEDTYLQLNLEDVQDSVSAIPGGFRTLGESGLQYYLPSSYIADELDEEELADDMVSDNVEQVDTNGNGYWDNDSYAYYYQMEEDDDLSNVASVMEYLKTQDNILSLYPIKINGRVFVFSETSREDIDTHNFRFYTFFDNGYELDVIYRTEHSIFTDDFRSMIFTLACGICPAS